LPSICRRRSGERRQVRTRCGATCRSVRGREGEPRSCPGFVGRSGSRFQFMACTSSIPVGGVEPARSVGSNGLVGAGRPQAGRRP
jgi:hypothetical protein